MLGSYCTQGLGDEDAVALNACISKRRERIGDATFSKVILWKTDGGEISSPILNMENGVSYL